MATCARCGGYLGDHHACHGRFAAAMHWSADVLLSSVVGAAIGVLLLGEAAVRVTGQSFEVVGLTVGPFLAYAVVRTLRRL